MLNLSVHFMCGVVRWIGVSGGVVHLVGSVVPGLCAGRYWCDLSELVGFSVSVSVLVCVSVCVSFGVFVCVCVCVVYCGTGVMITSCCPSRVACGTVVWESRF